MLTSLCSNNRLRCFTLFLSVLLCLGSSAQDQQAIQQLVHRWNEQHNLGQAHHFYNLYAPTVLFYGKYQSRSVCVAKKERFLSPDYRQAIVSPVVQTVYSSGTIKCDFTKRTTFRNLMKEHRCYLLVQAQADGYRITGESELEIDKRLGVSLNLGDVASTSRPLFAILFIAGACVVVLLLLIWLVFRRRRRKTHEESMATEPSAAVPSPAINEEALAPAVEEAPTQPVAEEILQPVMEDVALPKPDALTEKEKGDAFERYIVSRFTKEYFTLTEWRSDKYHEGVYATSNSLPDLEYQFQTKYYNLRFAVECKWRADFIKGRIEWAKSYQMVNYRDYEAKHGIPVFVIIGVGGQPHDPAAVYIVPLRDIRSNVLAEGQLKQYYRYKTGNFFLHVEQMRLE